MIAFIYIKYIEKTGKTMKKGRTAFVRLFILLFVLNFSVVTAQDEKLFHGIIIDNHTNSPIPGATVRLTETNKGTYSSSKGKFRLLVPAGKQIVKVSSLGYETQRINLENKSDSIIIKLVPSAVMLQGVQVTAPISPEEIIKRAVRKKYDNLNNIKTFSGLLYSKFSMELGGSLGSSMSSDGSGFTISSSMGLGGASKPKADEFTLYILESFSRNFIDYEKQINKSEIIQRRQTANIPASANLLTLSNFRSFYDDEIELFSTKITTPLAQNALDFYDYKIINKKMLDDRYVYEMSVTPKSTTYPLFVGTISIVEGSYNLYEVNLKPSQSTAVTFVRNLSFWQKFEEIKKNIWYPTFLEITADANVEVIKGMADLEVIVKGVSIYSEMTANEPLPDSIYYKNVPRISVASFADSSKSEFWEKNSLRDISEKELQIYKRVDSAVANSKYFNQNTESSFWLNYSYSPDLDFSKVISVTPGLNFNIYTPYFDINTNGNYSIGQKRFFGSAAFTAEYDISNKTKLNLQADVFSKINTIGSDNNYSNFQRMVTELMLHESYYDWYRSDGWRAGTGVEYKTLEIWADYEETRHSGLNNTTNRTFFSNEKLKNNIRTENESFRTVRFSLDAGDAAPKGIRNGIDIEFSMDYLIGKSINSNKNFFSGEGMLRMLIPTFKTGYEDMYFDITLHGGSASKDVPVEYSFKMNTDMWVLARPQDFLSAPYNIGGYEFAAVHLKYNFTDLFWRAFGLPLYENRGLDLSFQASSGRFLKGSKNGFIPTDGWYSEIGFGLSRIPTFISNLIFLSADFKWGTGNSASGRFGASVGATLPF